MENLRLSFCGFRRAPYVSIDGKAIKTEKAMKDGTLSLHLSPQKHKIVICEKRILQKWYWWLLCFNLLYPLLCFKGQSGKQAGYDGECITVSFFVACGAEVTDVKIVRREIAWENSPLCANYHALSLRSATPISLESASPDRKTALRLKACTSVPFLLVAILYTAITLPFLITEALPIGEMLLYCAVSIALVGYAAYKILKIKAQKSFSEQYKIARVEILAKKKERRT